MEYTQEMKNRLRRIEGQIRGDSSNAGRKKQDCKDVVTQLSASRAAIDRAIGVIVGTNLEHCLREQMEKRRLQRSRPCEGGCSASCQKQIICQRS
ncbi:hypothetical protein GCM10020331_086020 [Ectobacillus funiculus]